MLFLIIYCLVGSIVTKNYSYVDRQWSIVPALHIWIFCYKSGFAERHILMGFVATLWGARMTYNFWRKGGYSGEEDYRWKILQQNRFLKNRIVWHLFNVFFISIYQQILILAFVLPGYYLLGSPSSLNIWDFFIGFTFLFFLLIETIADQQQWNFQTKKYSLIAKKITMKPKYKRGFLTEGLFAYSRHPNFFSEQMMWICFYLFTSSGSTNCLNWSAFGPILLILLFQGSTKFTEQISVSKYKEYTDYQTKVNKFLPIKCCCCEGQTKQKKID